MNTYRLVADKRILILEDDAVSRTTIHRHLALAGYNVHSAPSAERAFALIHRHGFPHLSVVDINLPGISGMEFCRRIHESIDPPILVITDKNNYDTALTTLEHYADDFMLKPLRMPDLLTRIERILRRMHSFTYADAPLRIDDRLHINFARQEVEVDGHIFHLTAIESRLLDVLTSNANRALSYRTLLEFVWPNDDVTEDALRVQIHRLRAKVCSRRFGRYYIQTERGVGYRFVADTDAMGFAWPAGTNESGQYSQSSRGT